MYDYGCAENNRNPVDPSTGKTLDTGSGRHAAQQGRPARLRQTAEHALAVTVLAWLVPFVRRPRSAGLGRLEGPPCSRKNLTHFVAISAPQDVSSEVFGHEDGSRPAIAGALAVAGWLPSVVPAIAHHSGSGLRQRQRLLEITGALLRSSSSRNPHTWIQIVVEDAKGQKVEWSLEWGSPNNLGRRGYPPVSTFPPGARVTMRLRPMLNGAPAGAFVGGPKFADGKTVGRWDN